MRGQVPVRCLLEETTNVLVIPNRPTVKNPLNAVEVYTVGVYADSREDVT